MQLDTWRFLDTGAAGGAFNMAVDEGLARSTSATNPVLRLYRWQPFTISIGHHQDLAEIDVDRCRHAGVGVVRRPTGGRAIFHAHELTYSAIIPKAHPWFTKSSLEVYNEISSALVTGLRLAGLPATIEKRPQADDEFATYRHQFACFASSARYEIHFQNKKLVGSAQRRFDSALLQHGSLIIGRQHLDLVEFLTGRKNGQGLSVREQLQNKTTCIEAVLNRDVAYEEIALCVKSGFERYFKIGFEATALSAAELEIINKLKTNYSDLWRRL
ncbi:MAG TPA: lipoate--protein ligase family protein [bacterium]